MSNVHKKLETLLADTYVLYLKTQNYHWHVKGAQFKSLHELFENQYKELAEAVDLLAERLLILGHNAPATFAEFMHLKTINEGTSNRKANEMLAELAEDHKHLVKEMHQATTLAQDFQDEGTVSILSERIAAHQKAQWMLEASKNG